MAKKRAKVEGKGKDIFFNEPKARGIKSTSKHDDMLTSKHKRFTSYLLPENMRYLKRLAFEKERSIYSILAEIIEFYRSKHVDK